MRIENSQPNSQIRATQHDIDRMVREGRRLHAAAVRSTFGNLFKSIASLFSAPPASDGRQQSA